MVMLYSILTGLAFLIIISIIDVMTYNKEHGFIPSSLTTIFLIYSILVTGMNGVYIGILCALIGLLFTDLEIWGGIADYKVFVASGILLNSIQPMLFFSFFVVTLGLLYKLYVRYRFKKDEYIPFIPVLFVSYAILMLI